MKLKKNLRAKIAAIVASLGALAIGLGLVHQNPPRQATAADTPATSTGAPAAAPAQTNTRKQNAAPAPVVKKRHSRTHVS